MSVYTTTPELDSDVIFTLLHGQFLPVRYQVMKINERIRKDSVSIIDKFYGDTELLDFPLTM